MTTASNQAQHAAHARPAITRAALALIGFCLAYIMPSYAHTPNFFYDPLNHRWTFGASPGPIPMGYLGMCGYGLCGAAIGVLVSFVAPKLEKRGVSLLGAWALTALWLASAYFVWSLWPGG